MAPERLVLFRTRTILKILFVALAVFAAIELISIARQVITWILISLFLALALNPVVEFFGRRGIRRRPLAIGLTYLLVFALIAALGGTFVPILVDEVNDFAEAVPGYVNDLTEGRGRLGFLEREYHIVERIQDSVSEGGAARILGFSGAAISVTKGVVTAVVATITIAVLTFFMLLEGPMWLERVLRADAARGAAAMAQRRLPDLPHRRRLRERGAPDRARRRRDLVDPAHRPRRPVCDRARARRGAARPDPARRRDDRHRVDRDDRLPHVVCPRRGDRARVLHPLPAGRKPRHLPRDLLADGAALAPGDPDRGADRGLAGRDSRCARRHPGRRCSPGDPRRLPAASTSPPQPTQETAESA